MIPIPTKETNIINTLKKVAEESIIAPKFLLILTFPAVSNPDNAPSDGPNMLDVKNLKPFLIQLKNLDEVSKS